jgi:hypothetical protein
MPKTLTAATITELDSIRCPLAGETADAENAGDTGIEEMFLQPLTNNFDHLKERIPGASDTAQLIVIPVEQLWGVDAYWALDTSEVTRPMKQLQVGHSYHVLVEITHFLPYYGQISGYYARLRGGPSHSSLPGTGDMPELSLCSRALTDASSAALTEVDVSADGSATIGAFEAIHQIGTTLADGTAELGGTDRYFLRVLGEAGANAKVNLKIDCLFVEVTR